MSDFAEQERQEFIERTEREVGRIEDHECDAWEIDKRIEDRRVMREDRE